MLAARIKLGTKLFDTNTTPTFNFTQRGGRVRLNIGIDLDPAAFELADDGTHSSDPNENENLRDAKIGVDLLRGQQLNVIQLELIDPADDGATFTVSAKISTKLPGTGGDVEAFKAEMANWPE